MFDAPQNKHNNEIGVESLFTNQKLIKESTTSTLTENRSEKFTRNRRGQGCTRTTLHSNASSVSFS